MWDALKIRHPFFRPRWRRVVTVVLPAAWAVFELSQGNVIWAAVFGAAALWCVYELFIAFDPENFKDPNG